MVQPILFRIFCAFVAISIDKNDFLNFLFDFHSYSHLNRKWCEAQLRLCAQFSFVLKIMICLRKAFYEDFIKFACVRQF